MTKIPENNLLDADGVIERMMAVAKVDTQAELARLLRLSPQALGNKKKRASIALHLLLGFAREYHVSLDYLIEGAKVDFVNLSPAVEPPDEAKIKPTSPLSFDPRWLENVVRISSQFVRWHVDPNGGVLIIDVTHAGRQLGNGEYLIKTAGPPEVRKCKKSIVDGSVAIEGEGEVSAEQATTLPVIGRVAWRGNVVK